MRAPDEWPPAMEFLPEDDRFSGACAEAELEGRVGGGMMAVIIEAEEGEAISEATGVAESEAGLLSPASLTPLLVMVPDRELAALRLISIRFSGFF